MCTLCEDSGRKIRTTAGGAFIDEVWCDCPIGASERAAYQAVGGRSKCRCGCGCSNPQSTSESSWCRQCEAGCCGEDGEDDDEDDGYDADDLDVCDFPDCADAEDLEETGQTRKPPEIAGDDYW